MSRYGVTSPAAISSGWIRSATSRQARTASPAAPAAIAIGPAYHLIRSSDRSA